jgi:hypothetical protein
LPYNEIAVYIDRFAFYAAYGLPATGKKRLRETGRGGDKGKGKSKSKVK